MIDYIENLKIEFQKKTKNLTSENIDSLFIEYFGSKGKFTSILKKIKEIPENERPKIGKRINAVKEEMLTDWKEKKDQLLNSISKEWLDITFPGKRPREGHLHIVTQAIEEISEIFEKIGFTRMTYREIEAEWYAFDSLNMSKDSPARDDFETFFIDSKALPSLGRLVLSPHTSSGQVREMERLNHHPPIRMINIAKCYRPNWDISHTPMFHQFEGLVIDKGINITNLKGVMDYFAKAFFGPERKTRLRPFHFQFTEPSFEVDITCGICKGTGKTENNTSCRFCKDGWLELGGSGMVHPNVLKAGKIDPRIYSGFAFGWGIERTYMMKSGTKLEDIRILYGNDIRFLEQF